MSPFTAAEFSDLMSSFKPMAGEAIAVAVSGGADSLSLTVMLGQWCRENNISLTALTVDHGLRDASAEEAKTVGKWLEKYDIPHVILRWGGEKPQRNIQDQARLARYRLMGEWCQKHRASKLFLAHHQGDQAETFLMRLFRGSGIDGLSAMKKHSSYPAALTGEGDVIICRPLLDISKDSLEGYLRDIPHEWIEDPSNHNDSYMRVKVRNLLRNSDIEGLNVGRMAQTAARMGRVQSLLAGLTKDVTQEAVTFLPEGYADVQCAPLLAAHEEISLRCLAFLIRRISGDKYSPRLTRLEALYGRLNKGDFSGQTLGGCQISGLKNGHVIVSREVAAIQDMRPLEPDQKIVWDGRFIIENHAIVGRLKRLESDDWKALCLAHDRLKKIKLLKIIRESLPCIISESGEPILPNFIEGFETTGFMANLRQ